MWEAISGFLGQQGTNALIGAGIGAGAGYALNGKQGLALGALGGGALGYSGIGSSLFGETGSEAIGGELFAGGADWGGTSLGGAQTGINGEIFNGVGQQAMSNNIANTGNVGAFAQAGAQAGVSGMTGSQMLWGKGIEAGVGLYQAQGARAAMKHQQGIMDRQQLMYEDEYAATKKSRDSWSTNNYQVV